MSIIEIKMWKEKKKKTLGKGLRSLIYVFTSVNLISKFLSGLNWCASMKKKLMIWLSLYLIIEKKFKWNFNLVEMKWLKHILQPKTEKRIERYRTKEVLITLQFFENNEKKKVANKAIEYIIKKNVRREWRCISLRPLWMHQRHGNGSERMLKASKCCHHAMKMRHRPSVLKYNEEPLGILFTLNNGCNKTENTCKYYCAKSHHIHIHTTHIGKVLTKTIYLYPNNPYNNYPC